MSLSKALVVTVLMAGVLSGQTSEFAAQKERARQLLASGAWSDKAWGAYLAGRLHDDDLNRQLVDQLLSTGLRNMPTFGDAYGFTAVLFDALIESGAQVPAKLLEPFAQGWPDAVLILAARTSDTEDLLLQFSEDKTRNVVWLAANNILAGRKSQRWYEQIWREVSATHEFTVSDPAGKLGGTGGGIGGGMCGDGGTPLYRGFPPVVLYSVTNSSAPGDILLAKGPQDVSYRRATLPPEKQVGIGICESAVDRDRMRAGYLAQLRGESQDRTWQVFHRTTDIRYRSAAALSQEINLRLSGQAEQLRELARVIEASGLRAPDVQVRIVPQVVDRRQMSRDPLPPVPPREVRLR